MSVEKSGHFANFCEVCTCMGVIDWYKEKSCLGKLFWFLVITVGLGLTGVQTYLTFEQFLTRSDYQTKISTEFTQNGIPPPNITICNYNRAKQSLINERKLDSKVLVYLFEMVGAVIYPIPLSKASKSVLLEHEEAWKLYVENGGETDVENFLRMYGHQQKETVIHVERRFPNQKIDYLEVLTVYGLCWNVKLYESFGFVTGSNTGVKMLLDPLLQEYLKDVGYNNFLQQGFVIAINYRNEPFMPDPLLINPGTYTTIAVNAIKKTASEPSFPMFKKKCNENAVLKILNESYTPNNCVYDCYTEAMVRVCGCTLWSRLIRQYPSCIMIKAMDCAKPDLDNANITTDLFPFTKLVDQFRKCKENCIYPCEEYIHLQSTATSTSFSQNLKSTMATLLETTFNLTSKQMESLSNNVVALQIYLASDQFTIYETTETTPIMDFIGNVGGQLGIDKSHFNKFSLQEMRNIFVGLWLGISFCTILQVCYYSFTAVYKKCNCTKINGKKDEAKQGL